MKKMYNDPKIELILFGFDVLTTSIVFGTESVDNDDQHETITSLF